MANEQGTGLGGLGASIRNIFSRLSPLEKKNDEHDADIAALKTRAAAAEAELIRLTKISQHQGTELAKNQSDIDNLSRTVGSLHSEIEDKTDNIEGLKSTLHGERIKRGLTKAKLDKLESGSKRRGR
jgi:chromosome segregation ATPase